MIGRRPPRSCDLAVGVVIVGLAVARELTARDPGLRVAVLEREPGIAAHQTSHSSGVVHAEVYHEPTSLKARLCVAGPATSPTTASGAGFNANGAAS